MTISKAQWDTDGEDVRLSMPFSKVDKERRIVSGFATLDNVDKQNDIVTPEASVKAFQKFRGNIREMHQPISVGKMVSFKEDKYFDPETKKMYSGVYVSAYISKGAQDTWEKVLDGTLSGFSIGGRMNKWDDAFNTDMDKQVRVIKDYDLLELSLVDNPANQFANILSIQKVDGVDVMSGDVTDTVIENVFWDKDSNLVMLSENDNEVSPTTGKPMENIGFVEKSDSDKQDMIKFLVDSAKGIDLSKMTEEVGPMTETTENTVEDVAAEEVATESAEVAPEAEATADDVVVETEDGLEKSDEVEATADAEEAATVTEDASEATSEAATEVEADVEKADDVTALVSEIKDGLASAFSDLSAVVKSLNDEIAELKKSFGGVETRLNAVSTDVNTVKSDFGNIGKRVDAVEADTAFRKSGDLGEIVQDSQIEKSDKSPWGGRFLKTADLFR
jgi:hypothetical protein